MNSDSATASSSNLALPRLDKPIPCTDTAPHLEFVHPSRLKRTLNASEDSDSSRPLKRPSRSLKGHRCTQTTSQDGAGEITARTSPTTSFPEEIERGRLSPAASAVKSEDAKGPLEWEQHSQRPEAAAGAGTVAEHIAVVLAELESARAAERERDALVAKLEALSDDLRQRDAVIGEKNARIDVLERRIDRQAMRIDEQAMRIDEQNARIYEQNARIYEQNERLDEQKTRIHGQAARIDEQNTRFGDQSICINEQNTRINEQDTIIGEQNTRIGEQSNYIDELVMRLDGQGMEVDERELIDEQNTHLDTRLDEQNTRMDEPSSSISLGPPQPPASSKAGPSPAAARELIIAPAPEEQSAENWGASTEGRRILFPSPLDDMVFAKAEEGVHGAHRTLHLKYHLARTGGRHVLTATFSRRSAPSDPEEAYKCSRCRGEIAGAKWEELVDAAKRHVEMSRECAPRRRK